MVIGGNAVIAYGYPRQTHDFDFLVDSRHRFRWDQIIRELGYQMKHSHPVFHMYQSELPDHPPVDLMLVDHETFVKFDVSSKEATVERVTVRIPALLHLLALKLHAERSGGERRIGRDINDVLHLMQLNHIKLDAPEFQKILTRYGNDSIRQRLAVVLASASESGLRPPGGR